MAETASGVLSARRGESESPASDDYEQFKRAVLKRTGIDLSQYKQQQMHRRLFNMVERGHYTSFMEYFTRIEGDSAEYGQFLDRLTINVSELFRNPEKWEELRSAILPPMLARKRSLKIWSAGCSYGAEPYTLAILLDRLSPGTRHTLHATDLDKNILAKAREGRYIDADVRNVPPDAIGRYFTRTMVNGPAGPAAAYQVSAEIRSRVQFRSQNLLSDRFESDYDLICCRNVVIYFTDPAKDALFERFRNALAPGGILFVGGTERIFNSKELGFELPLPFFYRRPLA